MSALIGRESFDIDANARTFPPRGWGEIVAGGYNFMGWPVALIVSAWATIAAKSPENGADKSVFG